MKTGSHDKAKQSNVGEKKRGKAAKSGKKMTHRFVDALKNIQE
jgi:RecB family endonuclease NucS